MWPAHHISMMTIRGESSCLQSLKNTPPPHCQSIKFQGHAELPKFSAKPILFPDTFSVYHTLPQRCWLVEKCGTVSAGRWSVHAPPTSSEQGSTASARNSTQLVQNLQGMAVHRRWMLAGYQDDSYVCTCAFLYVTAKRSARETLTFVGI